MQQISSIENTDLTVFFDLVDLVASYQEKFDDQFVKSFENLRIFIEKVDDLFLRKIAEMSTTEEMKKWEDCCSRLISRQENMATENLQRMAHHFKEAEEKMFTNMRRLFDRAMEVRLEIEAITAYSNERFPPSFLSGPSSYTQNSFLQRILEIENQRCDQELKKDFFEKCCQEVSIAEMQELSTSSLLALYCLSLQLNLEKISNRILAVLLNLGNDPLAIQAILLEFENSEVSLEVFFHFEAVFSWFDRKCTF